MLLPRSCKKFQSSSLGQKNFPVFDSLTTGGEILLQIGCPVVESVPIRVKKGLEDCLNVAQVA